MTHKVHQKGFDSFSTSEYVEDGTAFKQALRLRGWEVTHLPAHRIEADFPKPNDLSDYDVVVISDVGANSFQLTRSVVGDCVAEPDRLEYLRDYIYEGGGLIMVGGYMSFSGIEAKARYARSPLAEVLPVEVLDRDDRAERPAGVTPAVVNRDHAAVAELGLEWPALLGYNETRPRAGAQTLVTVDGDPLIAVGEYGKGRSAVFTSDMAPHWAPPSFLAWSQYGPMWASLLRWVAN
jgi:uncharacterized membrane protein